MGDCKGTDCGNCKHFHKWSAEREYEHMGHFLANGLCLGDCDKIPEGTQFENGKYAYDGYSFCDENYDEEFHCFEPCD